MRPSIVVFLGTLFLAGGAGAQTLSVAAVFDNQLQGVESEVVSLAEAMPAAKYNFVPAAGEFKTVRNFGQQVTHVATVLYMVSASMLGEKMPVDAGASENGAASLESKEQIVKYLKDAFAYSHKAMQGLTGENLVQMVKSPFGQGQMPKGGLASILTDHSFDHYGQMVIFARMNGIVPPASR